MSIVAQRARALGAVATNTLRQAVRSKVFGTLLFFSILLVLSSLVLGEMSLHHESRVALDTSLFFSTLFAAMMAIYSSITLFFTEIERRTIYTILSKPIPRWLFLVGKFLGVSLLNAIVVVLLFLLSALMAWIQSDAVPIQLPIAFTTLYFQLTITTALAHLIATVSNPLLAGFASAALFVGGNLFTQLAAIKELLEESNNPLSYAITALEYLLPNLESLNLSRELTYAVPVPPSYLGAAALYTLTYSALALLLGVLFFSKKDVA